MICVKLNFNNHFNFKHKKTEIQFPKFPFPTTKTINYLTIILLLIQSLL